MGDEVKSSNRKEMLKLLADFGTIGLNLASAIFIGLAFGYFLDHKVFHEKTYPWLTLLFMALGIVAGFKNLFMLAKRKDL